MDASILGVILDSSLLIAAERRRLTAHQSIESIRQSLGSLPVALSAVTVAEIGHGIYRANSPEIQRRRRAFLDDLKSAIPIHPISATTAEIVARIGGQQASQGVNLPIADLLIGASAIELGYAVATSNLRDFTRIPGLRVLSL